MLSHKNPIYQYLTNIGKKEICYIFLVPLVISFLLTCIVKFGNLNLAVNYLFEIIPTLSSIIVGFLGMIIISTLSNNEIFERMKNDRIKDKHRRDVSLFRIFIYGIYFNIIAEIILLFTSIFLGFFNSSYQLLSDSIMMVQFFVLLYLLITSSLLFYKNMDRIYQDIIHENA